MDLRVVFLGTAGAVDKIFFSHLHGDHYLGLPGLMKTLGLQGRTEPLELYGPRGLEELMTVAQRVFGRHQYPVVLHEAKPGIVLETDGYRMEAWPTDHGPPSLAWCLHESKRPGEFHPERAQALGLDPGPAFRRLQMGEPVVLESGVVIEPEQVMDEPRPGRKLVFTGDTRPTDHVAQFARGATVLVHDSTFASSELERALETRHSTSAEAAEVAVRAGVDLLVLTHVSSRHSRRELVSEARAVFRHAFLPDDLDELIVPYPDKGTPYFVRPAEGSCGCPEHAPGPTEADDSEGGG